MKNYGLTKIDLEIAREKINMQKDYLVKNELITSNGQVKKLIDLSFSANHSYRYYAQLSNKINTMEQIALNENLKPIFTTMTLDGFYRDLIKGDYSRFEALGSHEREKALSSVPDDGRFGFIRTKMINNEKLDIKDLYKILSFQMRQFRGSKCFRALKKYDKTYIYIRTVEPHKDGVPHFHMILYVPEDFIPLFKEQFEKFFVAPRNKKPDSFQTDIKKASAYIMKYITKSFMDIKSGKELDYINAWFVKHKIMRCITSRSVVPQWVYQKIAIFESDWYYLTDILNSPNNTSEWSKEHNSFWLYDTWSDREIEYLHGRLSIYSSGYLVKRSGKVNAKPHVVTSYEKIPKTWTKKKEYVPIFENGNLSMYYKDGKFHRNNKHITQMKDYELYEHYNAYDVENSNYTHYLAIRNLMITRGLLNGEIFNLNNFSIERFLGFK